MKSITVAESCVVCLGADEWVGAQGSLAVVGFEVQRGRFASPTAPTASCATPISRDNVLQGAFTIGPTGARSPQNLAAVIRFIAPLVHRTSYCQFYYLASSHLLAFRTG